MPDTHTEVDFVETETAILAVAVTFDTDTGEITGTDVSPVCQK
jgi:hypothetical protein